MDDEGGIMVEKEQVSLQVVGGGTDDKLIQKVDRHEEYWEKVTTELDKLTKNNYTMRKQNDWIKKEIHLMKKTLAEYKKLRYRASMPSPTSWIPPNPSHWTAPTYLRPI